MVLLGQAERAPTNPWKIGRFMATFEETPEATQWPSGWIGSGKTVDGSRVF